MAGLTFNTKQRAQPAWPANDTSLEPYFDSAQSWATNTFVPGFNGGTAGRSIRLPGNTMTLALTLWNIDGTQVNAGAWDGGLTPAEMMTNGDSWVGWWMDNTDSMLYCLVLDNGTAPDTIGLAKVNEAGTITQIGSGQLGNTSLDGMSPVAGYNSPLYRKGGDGSGDFAIRHMYVAGGNSAAGVPQRGAEITISASNGSLSYANVMPNTYGSNYGYLRTHIGPTANGIIGGPYYGPQANIQNWYGPLWNTNNGKGYYNVFYEGASLPEMAGGASSMYIIRWREGYIHMNWGQHYGPVYYKEADMHNYLDEMAVYYGIL